MESIDPAAVLAAMLLNEGDRYTLPFSKLEAVFTEDRAISFELTEDDVIVMEFVDPAEVEVD